MKPPMGFVRQSRAPTCLWNVGGLAEVLVGGNAEKVTKTLDNQGPSNNCQPWSHKAWEWWIRRRSDGRRGVIR